MFKGQPQLGLPSPKAVAPGKLILFLSKQINFSSIQPQFTRMLVKATLGVFFAILLLGSQPLINSSATNRIIAKAEAETEQTQVIGTASLPFATQLPHPAYISQYFSSYHPGVDLATGLGMLIKPIADGTVLSTGYDLWGYGLNVVIDHGSGYTSLYAHMGKIYLQQGQKVTRSDILGEVGLTGHTTGPHTHLEVTKDSVKINPLTIMPPVRTVPVAEDFVPVNKAETTNKQTATNSKSNNMTQAAKPKKVTLLDLIINPQKVSDAQFVSKLLVETNSSSTSANSVSFAGGRFFYLESIFPSFSETKTAKENNITQIAKSFDLSSRLSKTENTDNWWGNLLTEKIK